MNTKQQAEAERMLDDAKTIIDRADAEGRVITDAESTRVEGLLSKAKRLKTNADVEGQIDTIGRAIGAPEYVPSDPRGVAGAGWAQVAEAIGSKRQNHVEVPTQSLLGKSIEAEPRRKDLTATDMAAGVPLQVPGLMTLGADRRFLHPLLPQVPVAGQLSVSDFRQTGSRTVTGDVERALTATTAKAELDLAIEHVSEELRQVAVVISNVPNALLRGVPALRTFLQSEGQFQLQQAIDDHVITALETSAHTLNAEGTGTVARLRNAIAAHRAEGRSQRSAPRRRPSSTCSRSTPVTCSLFSATGRRRHCSASTWLRSRDSLTRI